MISVALAALAVTGAAAVPGASPDGQQQVVSEHVDEPLVMEDDGVPLAGFEKFLLTDAAKTGAVCQGYIRQGYIHLSGSPLRM